MARSLRELFPVSNAPVTVQPPEATPDELANAIAEQDRQALAASSPFQAGVESGLTGLRGSGIALQGLAQAAVGDEVNGANNLRRAGGILQRAEAYTPDNAGDVADAYKTGNLGKYAAYQVGSLAPGIVATAVPALLTGGVGGAVAGGARAAALRGGAALAEDAVESVAQKAAIAGARHLGSTIGEQVGAVGAGAVSSAGSSSRDVLADPGDGSTLQERAQKGLAGTLGQGVVQAVPGLALLHRYGLGAAAESALAKRLSAPVVARLAREGGEQAVLGGAGAVGSVAADRALHEWVTGSPDAAPALPQYFNALASGVIGGAVFGAPAGFKGETAFSSKLRDAAGKIRDDINARAPAAGPKFGEEVPTGAAAGKTKAAPEVDKAFNDAFEEVSNGQDDFHKDLLEGVKGYDLKREVDPVSGEVTSVTLNGPAKGLFDPEKLAARAPLLDSLDIHDPTERLIGSIVGDDAFDGSGVDGIKATAKAMKTGYDSLSDGEQTATAKLAQTLDPDQRKQLFNVLATTNKIKPDERATIDYRKAGVTADPEARPIAGEDAAGLTEQDAPQGLGYVADDAWKSARFFGDDSKRRSPPEENVRLSENSGGVSYSIRQLAASLVSTPEGRELVKTGNRKVNSVLGVAAEALERGTPLDASSIREGLRVFGGEDGKLSANEATVIRQQLTQQARKSPPIVETPGRAKPTAPYVPESDTRVQDAVGDIQGAADAQRDVLGPDEKTDRESLVTLKTESAMRRNAAALGLPTSENGTPRTPSQLYEDALHLKQSARRDAVLSDARRLADTDNGNGGRNGDGLAGHLEAADQRKAVSDFAGERITGDNGALIPYLKKLDQGKVPTAAQRDAFAAVRERTDTAKLSEKQEEFVAKLRASLEKKGISEDIAQGARPAPPEGEKPGPVGRTTAPTRKEPEASVKAAPAPTKEEIAATQAETQKRLAADEARAAAKAARKETLNSLREEAASSGTSSKRLDQIAAKAEAKANELGKDHPRFDDLKKLAEDATDRAALNRAADKENPKWFDKDVPLAEQRSPKGEIEESIRAIQKTPEYKRVDQLMAAARTMSERSSLRGEKEQKLVSELARAFGVKDITLLSHGDGPNGIMNSRGELSLNDKLHGAARVSTILHEFGHHMVMEKFGTTDVATRRALAAEYRAWRAKNVNGKNAFEIRASRAPFFSSIEGLRAFDTNGTRPRPAERLSAEQRSYLLNFHEFMADGVARALEQHEGAQGIVGKFFSRIAQLTKIAYDLLRGHDSRLTESPSAVRDWVRDLWLPQRDEVGAAASATSPPSAGAASTTHTANANTAAGAKPGATMHTPGDVSSLLPQYERGLVRDAMVSKPVMDQLLKAAPDQAARDRLLNFATQTEEAVNRGFELWAAGKLDLKGKDLSGALGDMAKALLKTTGITTRGELRDKILADLKANQVKPGQYDVRKQTESAKRADLRAQGRTNELAVRKAVTGVKRLVDTKLAPVYNKTLVELDKRMRDLANPALNKIADAVHRQTGETGTAQPMAQAIAQKRGQLWDRATDITKDLSLKDQARLLKALRTKTKVSDPALEVRRAQIADLMKNVRDYMVDAGADVGNLKDYWPVVLDPKKVANRADDFKGLLSDPKLEAGMRAYFKSKGWPDADKLTQAKMVDSMYEMAASTYDYSLGGKSFSDGSLPGGKEFRPRVSEFIYKTGDQDLINQFSKYQTGSLEQTLIPYMSHATRRAEFARRFGQQKDMKTSPLEQLLTQAKALGAKPEDIQLAKDFIDASLGSYGTGPNPFFTKVLGSFDRVFDTKLSNVNSAQYRKISNAVIAYQNLRTLGLGLFGNLIDPLGVWTRSTSAGDTWKGYKAAAAASMKKNPSYLRDMAESLGVVERHAVGEALAYAYGGSGDDIGSISNKINRALFKANGMELVTGFARLAATETANKFLLRHAAGADRHSERFLRELGVKPSDVVEDPQHPGYVQRNEKIDKAIFQFVDESVLRPVATQRPLWHNDPHFAIASQYKGYLYSFYNTIVQRMLHEAGHGNFRGITPIAGYIGVSMAAEWAREMVQYGTDGNPRRKSWGAGDYLQLAADRSGLAGPRFGLASDSFGDADRGNLPGQSALGPSVGQASDIVKTIAGRRSAESTAIQALPGQSVYKGWLHDDNQSSGEPTQRGQAQGFARP